MTSNLRRGSVRLSKEVDAPRPESELEGLPSQAVQSTASSRHPNVSSTWLLFILCIFMHVILVGIHLVLVILRFKLQDDSIKVPENNLDVVTGTLFYYVTFSPNLIVKIYLIPLLFITQKLALHRDLHLEQTLTAMHDKSSAWLSLGATGATLWKYRNLLLFCRRQHDELRKDLRAFGAIICILFYFTGGIVVTILAPDLITPGGIIGDPTDIQKLTQYVPNIGQDPNQIQEAFPIVDIIPLLLSEQDVLTTGLTNNLIYDVPNFATDSDVFVNGTIFDAICQAVPGLKQSGNPVSTNSSYPIFVHDQLANIDVSPTSRTLNIRPTLWVNNTKHAPSPPVVLLASTLPVLDDAQSEGTSTALEPHISPTHCIIPSDCSSVSSIQVMACNVKLTPLPGTVQVFTDFFPFSTAGYNESLNFRSSSWVNWTLPDTPVDPSLYSIGIFGELAPASHSVQFYTIDGSTTTANNTLSLLEDNLMEALGYYRDGTRSVKLADLEVALEQAISAVYWRAAVRAVNNQTISLAQREYDYSYTVSISKWTPLTAFAVSLAMTGLAIILTIPPKLKTRGRPVNHVDGLGVLELTWLLGQDKQGIAEQLSKVEGPTLDRLRAAGKDIPVAFCD